MTYETSSIWNDTKKLYEPPKSTRFFDQSDLPDLKNYVHIQSNRQVLLNSQTSNVNYNPFSYPQQKTKSNLPVDFFHLQNKISIVEQVSSSDSNIIPTFELTPEQFANPIKFIESISATGRKYGAVKIIPPSVPTTATSNGSNGTSNGAPSSEADSFKTNFQINADLFWFQTNRLLNNPNGDELNNRLKFHQELIKFHLNHAKESRNPSPIPSSKGDNADGKVGDGDAMVIDEPTGASVAASSPILTPVRIPQTTEAETKPEVKIENNDVEGIKKGESVSVSVEQIQPELPREGPQASQSTPPAVLQAAEPEGRKEAEPIRTQAEEESNRMTPTMELKVLSTQDPVVVPEQMPPPDRNPSKSVPQDEQSPIIESQRTKSDPIVKSEQDVSVPSDTPKTETKPKKIQLPSFLNKLPMIDKRPLDLYKLFRSVLMRGGFVEVINKKLWAQIGRELGYRGKIMTSLSSSLKSSYMKILYPFELYLAKTREKKRETHPHETSQKRRRINDTPLILGSPKTFKRSVRLKADKGFLLNSPHLTDVKQPTTLVSKKLEFYSVADASPDGTPNPQTPPPPPPPVVENLVAETKKRKGKNKLTVINTGDKVNNIPITPTSQLNYSLKSLVEIPGVQDALQFTSNGRFSSVYTLRQFMEKDLKFQEFLIQKNDSKFSKVPYGGISSEEATSLVSKFTYYNPKDGLSNGVVSPIVTSASSAPTPTSTHVPVPTTVPGGDKVPVNSLTEKNVIHIEKLEEMYWKFASNKEENLISGEGDVEGDLDLLHDGLEIENGVSLPSLVNGSGFVRLGDDLLNYKNILANVSTNSVSSGPQQGSSTNNTATPVVAHASGIASPNSSGSTTANSSSRAPGSAFDGAYYNSSDYSSKIIRSSLNPWNLHNLPILPNSLFGALGEHDVNNQDLYIPTLNIGMTFSTENWHAEDHFTQLCNYQFFGGHRKWYFIPEEEFDKFEELIIERTNDERRIHVNNNSWDCEALIQNFTTNTKTSADDLSSDSGKNNIENEALISSLENMIPPYLDYNNSRLEHKNPTFQKLIDFQRVKRSKGNKKLVPSLNQDCFITPETLEEAGINYTYAIQKPGEFIIKFPKTYSSTISFGLNLSEEVNFATSNWLDYALEGEKWINKQLLLPNFLTFKLLINLAQLHETTSPKNKVYFDAEVYCKALEMYEKLYEKEVENREKVRTLTKNIKEVIEEKSFLDGDSIADDDLKNIFPSKIVITDIITGLSMIISLENFLEYKESNLIDGSAIRVEMHLYCSDEKLRHFDKVLRGYSVDYGKWTENYEELMRDNVLLPLKALKSLLLEGEKIYCATSAAFFTTNRDGNDPGYSTFKSYVENLREFVTDANEFVEESQRVLSVKHQQRIRGGGRRRQSIGNGNIIDEMEEEYKSTGDDFEVLQRLVRLLNKIPTLSFHCPEADQIVEFQTEIENFEKASRNFLEDNTGKLTPSALQEFDDLISLGESFGVDLPSLSFLIRLRERIRWLDDYEILVSGGDPIQRKNKDKYEKTFSILDLRHFYQRAVEILGEGDSEKYQSVGAMIEKSVKFDQKVTRFLEDAEIIDNISLDSLENILTEYETEVIFLSSLNHEKLMKIKENVSLIKKYLELKTDSLSSSSESKKYKIAEVNLLQTSLVESGLKFDAEIIELHIKKSELWLEEVISQFKDCKYSTTIAKRRDSVTKSNSLSILEDFTRKNEFSFGGEEIDNYKFSSSYVAIQESEGNDIKGDAPPPIYCICREYEAGTMIECDACQEWYHVQCIHDVEDYEAPENYSCPMCILISNTGKIDDKILLAKPKLSKLQVLLDAGERLIVQPSNEAIKLKEFVSKCSETSEKFINKVALIEASDTKYKLDEIRFYLRKSYGAAVHLDDFFESTLQKVRAYLKDSKKADISIDTPLAVENSGLEEGKHDNEENNIKTTMIVDEDIKLNLGEDKEMITVDASEVPQANGLEVTKKMNIAESDMEIDAEVEIGEQSTIDVAEENLTEGIESEAEYENGKLIPIDTSNIITSVITEETIDETERSEIDAAFRNDTLAQHVPIKQVPTKASEESVAIESKINPQETKDIAPVKELAAHAISPEAKIEQREVFPEHGSLAVNGNGTTLLEGTNLPPLSESK